MKRFQHLSYFALFASAILVLFTFSIFLDATSTASVTSNKTTLKTSAKEPMKISKSSVSLEVGNKTTLKVTGTTSKVSWSSSKSSVASVSSSGVITGKAPGTATITATVAGKKFTSKITVKEPIKISKSAVSIDVGNKTTLKVTGTASKVTWSSSKPAVASVSSKGVITAKTSGTTTITASVAGKKLTSKVTVKEPIKISKSSVSLITSNNTTLKITGTTSKVTWSSSKPAVASISSKGKITAKAPGTTTITASVAGKKLTSKVKVTAPALKTTTEKAVPPSSVTATPTTTPNTNVTPTPNPDPAPSTAPSTELDTIPTTPVIVPTPTPTTPPKPAEPSTRVVGYYAAWSRYSGFSPDKIDANKLTHINYAFANIGGDNRITLGYPDVDPGNINQLNQLKKTNPNLRTLIAVGGWSWSGRFSDVALTEESRDTFADSAVDFVVKYNFDGIDIDWEYPVGGGLTTNKNRPEDKQNFTLLMKTLREKLDAQGKIDGKNYLLTFAGAAGSWYVNNTELNKLKEYVDYANIMTYDIHGTWDMYTDFNAPLYNNNDGSPQMKWSVDSSIKSWINAGFPKDKIVMGVPFYGYIYKSAGTDNNGLYQMYSGGASISYANIAGNYLNNPKFVRYFHSESMVPWLFDGSTFISYEDEQSMAAKAQYIKNNGLGGAMIWELSQDPNKILLNSLYRSLQ